MPKTQGSLYIGNGWSPERRKKQSERLRKQKPWLKSTGPKTPAGKERSKMNALKHGWRSARVREFHALLHEQQQLVRKIESILRHCGENQSHASPPCHSKRHSCHSEQHPRHSERM